MLKLDPPPKVITFDCYGTLVQWHEVLEHEVATTLRSRGKSDAAAYAIVNAFSLHSRRLTSEKPHRLFKDVMRIGFTAAFREHGIALTTQDIERIVSCPTIMPPHPEVRDALQRLQRHYKLAILSNTDDDLIAPTLVNIGVRFDHVITGQQARHYKPAREIFDYSYARMGVRQDETVHVAMGMYTDMKPSREIGVRAIWVNRRKENGNLDWRPYTEVSNLTEAAEILVPSGLNSR